MPAAKANRHSIACRGGIRVASLTQMSTPQCFACRDRRELFGSRADGRGAVRRHESTAREISLTLRGGWSNKAVVVARARPSAPEVFMLCRVSCKTCHISCLWTDDPRGFLASVCLRYRHCQAKLINEGFERPLLVARPRAV